MPLIIIEGTDGSGKTAIGQELAKQLGVGWHWHKGLYDERKNIRNLQREGMLPPGFNDAAVNVAANEVALKYGLGLVKDRGVMSAHIYRLMHNWPGLTRAFMHWYWNKFILSYARQNQVLFVEIIADIDTMYERRSDR